MSTERENTPDSARPQRKSTRVVLDAQVVVRRAGFPNFRVRICNLSPDGCAVEFIDRPRIDERVWVKLERIESIGGRVCWVENGLAGVQFDQAIHPAVFDLLVGKLS